MHLLHVSGHKTSIKGQGLPPCLNLQLHLSVRLGWLLENQTQIDGGLLVVHLKLELLEGGLVGAFISDQPDVKAGFVVQIIHSNIVALGIHPPIFGRDGQELIGVEFAWFHEVLEYVVVLIKGNVVVHVFQRYVDAV